MRPPCSSVFTGRPITELLHIYRNALPNHRLVSDGVYVSNLDLTLEEFCKACKAHCLERHDQTKCKKCTHMIAAAEVVERERICTLSSLFKEAFPGVSYTSDSARKCLLQIPLVCIRVGEPSDGTSQLLVFESTKGADYQKIRQILSANIKSSSLSSTLTKKDVKQLLGLAQSDRERECLRYAIFKSSGLTPSGARRKFGFERMAERSAEVERCIKETEEIRRSCEELASVRLKALKTSTDSSSEDESEGELPTSTCLELSADKLRSFAIVLKDSQFNWFEFYQRLESEDLAGNSEEELSTHLEAFYQQLSSVLSESEIHEVDLSRDAFKADDMLYGYSRSRDRRVLNREVVTDSESDDPSAYLQPQSQEFEAAIEQKAAAIKRQIRRKRAKMIANQHFLGRRKSKRLSTIVESYLDIGTTIEKFVESCNVGADAWRRTGLLTFDGNIKVGKKCMYKRIQEHLESEYGRHFAYGTVVQLCVARNRRHLSASRYRGVAQVTSRRARKGFMLKYNPDTHWSNSLYRSLNILQLTDGNDILFVNRDDASGFRLDSLTTHHQFSNPVVKGKEILTTYTDYVNRHPSVLQTSNYNFTGTKTTPELCAGVVKAQPLFPKCPAQHVADFTMLQSQPDLISAFSTLQGNPKPIECVRVDGASDEGPAHEEVQYWWAERHLLEAKVVTLVTTRSSGSSYLNRVELQNGCLARAHCNLFLPSTLHGSPISPETGKIDYHVLHQNLSTAIDVYIQRCDGAPCGRTEIHLYKGAQCDMSKRENLLLYLKGTKAQQRKLEKEHPALYSHFQKVWGVRRRHLVAGLPPQYIFFLRCCYHPDCPHPVCRGGKPDKSLQWYADGPSIDFFPVPVPDPSRPYGASSCPDCKQTCSGHYLKPDENLQNIQEALVKASNPPSVVIKEFLQSNRSPSESQLRTLARSVLLPVQDVKLWVEHLETVAKNRKRGAAKAAATRKAKRQQCCKCGICGQEYMDETDDVQYWIQCDNCNVWYHWDCAGVQNEPDTFFCSKCQS